MSYQSEAQLEDNLIKQLVNQGFNKVKIANEEELKNNQYITREKDTQLQKALDYIKEQM